MLPRRRSNDVSRSKRCDCILRQSPWLIPSKPLPSLQNVAGTRRLQRSAHAELSIGLEDQHLAEVSVCSSCMTTPVYALSASSDACICHCELSNSDLMHLISTPSSMPRRSLCSLTFQAKRVLATSTVSWQAIFRVSGLIRSLHAVEPAAGPDPPRLAMTAWPGGCDRTTGGTWVSLSWQRHKVQGRLGQCRIKPTPSMRGSRAQKSRSPAIIRCSLASRQSRTEGPATAIKDALSASLVRGFPRGVP